ncbi:transglycosylase SLT domain-containing protein [Burkholderia multivorans]|uniref:transglycosylase SLT domain-containing protein n=1 Tax=Burkholderia multivorans TaxID=87883 RepID=UPI001C252957|nr:transglycosylase SLT domain-containing protein [Burkholderia multivorans]MBU9376292.1 transglycosylase SLT domain-containing protein [Burkholderia multivorans]
MNFTQDQLDKLAENDRAIGAPLGASAAQIWQESRNNPNAVSPKGALGYAQVMPKTLAKVETALGRRLDPTNFDDSLQIQRYIMTQNMQRFGNYNDALRAYNSGWDPEKWNNDETNAYVSAITGEDGVSASGRPFVASGTGKGMQLKPDPITLALQRRANAQPVADELADGTAFDETPLRNSLDNMALEDAAAAESAAGIRALSEKAGFVESFVQAAHWDTLAGRLQDAWQAGADDPNWRMSDAQKQYVATEAPEIWADDHLRDYVGGARSQVDYERRLGLAQQQADFQRRAANSGWTSTAGQLLAGAGDPVMLGATIGAGAIANAARAAFAIRAAEGFGAVAGSMAEGAAGNMLASAAITRMDNGSDNWPELFRQGVLGALLGGLGRAAGLHAEFREAVPETGAKMDGHAIEAHIEGQNEAINDLIGRAASEVKSEDPLQGIRDSDPLAEHKVIGETETRAGDHGAGDSRIADAVEEFRAEQAEKAEAEARAKEAEKLDPEARQAYEEAATNEATERDVASGAEARVNDEWQTAQAVRMGQIKDDMLSAAERARGATTDSHTELMRLATEAKDPMVQALARRLMETQDGRSPAPIFEHPGSAQKGGNARSHYNPSTHEIHMWDHDANDHPVHNARRAAGYVPKGGLNRDEMLLHEIAHSVTAQKIRFGKAHPRSAHGQLVGQLDKLRQRALREYKGTDYNTRYYLGNVDEFVAGLYSGQSEFINHLKSLKVKNGNILSKTVDAVRALLGLRPDESNMLTKALGLSDHLVQTPLRADLPYARPAGRSVLTKPGVARDDVPLGALAQKMAEQLENWKEVLPKETEKLRRNASVWYDSVRGKSKAFDAIAGKLDSIGLTLGRSANKDVRYVASMLAEDPTGVNRQHASSAAIDKVMLASNWRKPVAEMWNRVLPELMTNEERVRWSQGIFAGDAEKRISRLVQEERLANRNARLNGTEYKSQAHPLVKQMAAVVDGFWKDVTEMGTKYGEAKATAISKRGWQGYMPYAWDWRELQAMYNDPARVEEWNSFKGMLRQQYLAKVIEPALDKLNAAGPATQESLLALGKRVREQAANLTDRYLTQIIRDPESRIAGSDDHFGSVAADMLKADFKGKKVTGVLADEFKKALTDVISDRTRTEFDLLARQPDGVRLLDYIDTDIGRMIEGQSSEFAGRIALAKRGLKDDAHWTAMKDALVSRGAKPEEVDALEFLHKSLTDRVSNKDNPVAQFLAQTAHMSMMGKLGFNALADAASIIASSGVTGMFKSIFKGMGKDTELVKQLNRVASSAMGLDHRLHFGETRSGATLTHTGSALQDSAMWRRIGRQGMDIVGKLSGAHYVSKALHRGFVPLLAEDLAKAIKGTIIEDGVITSTGSDHLNPARLVDSGLTADRVQRIKEAMEMHDAGRKEGELFSWDAWDKTHPGAAEDMIAAIHRVTGQALQRAFIGETPRWLSEGIVGKYAGQFKKYGITAQEKQLMRNAFIADRNSATGFVMGTAWGAALYYAKTMASTIGMSEQQREKYVREHMSGIHLASGVAVMTNLSGMLGDGLDAANVLMGGQTNAGGSPIVAIGQLQAMTKAAGAVGGAALGALGGGTNPFTGKPVDYVKNVRTAMRVLPGANTLIGSALANELNQ